MNRISKKVVFGFGVLMLMAVLAGRSPAQTAVYVSPAPRVSILPRVSYYAAPTTVYYSPAPVVSYYTPPAVSYYTPPAVSYYTPPAVSYYTPPAVSYYAPAPAASVTTYRGILPWRSYSAVRYYP